MRDAKENVPENEQPEADDAATLYSIQGQGP
jgi:hypothetical protein